MGTVVGPAVSQPGDIAIFADTTGQVLADSTVEYTSIPTMFTTDSGNAIVNSNTILISGGSGITTSGFGNAITISSSGGGGTVTSVSGTTNRITSTGGATPVIDISASYVGQSSITTLGTITTGIWNGTTIGPTFGGTGLTSYTTGDTLYASASNTLSKLPVGTNGQVLTLAAGIPSWATPTTGTVTSVSGTANQVAVATGTTTPVISLVGPYTPATYTAHGVLIGEGTSSIVALAAGSAGQVLQSGGASADPTYSTATYPSTATGTGTILRADGTNWIATTATYPNTIALSSVLYASSANVISELTTVNNRIFATGTTGIPVWSSQLAADYTFTSAGAGATRTLTISNTNNSNTASTALLNIITGGASAGDPFLTYTVTGVTNWSTGIDNSVSGDPYVIAASTALGTTNVFSSDTSGNITITNIASGTWSGTAIDATHGGTAQTSWTTGDILYASAANTLSKLAVGSNTNVLTLAAGVPTWAAPATSGTVTSVSGTTNRITSTGGATPVIDISASYVGQSSITTLGTIATGVWNGTVIDLAHGGTNANLTASNGGIFYSTATAGAILAGTATANKVLMSGASTTPVWSTPTYPNTSGTAGKVIVSDGTNNVYSTPTFPNASATSGKIIQSDGTNWVASTPTHPSTAGSAGQIFRSDGTNFLLSTATYPNTGGTSGNVLTSDGTNWASTAPVVSVYTDGTWTPTIVGGSTAGSTVYNTQVGLYTKIGPSFVYVYCNVGTNSMTGTGDVNMGGLPFTTRNTSNHFPIGFHLMATSFAWPASRTMLTWSWLSNTTSAGALVGQGSSQGPSNVQMANSAQTFRMGMGYQI